MVILHDAIKTIENGVFAFFIKKEQKPGPGPAPPSARHCLGLIKKNPGTFGFELF